MKELSIEEKAKHYDEAIEALCSLFAKQAIKHCDRVNIKDITNIFPELKESESSDERIRKALIGGLKDCIYSDWHDGVSTEECIAYLEKQGEQKPTKNSGKKSEDVIEEKDMTEYKKGFECGKQRVLKYPEDFNLCKKSAECSEEDEKMLNDIIKDLVHPWNEYIPDRIEDEIKWLKTKLKSLRPQSTWKPSDEHYELEEFAKIVRGNLTGISKDVQKLFEAKYLQLTGNKMYGGFKD